MHGFKFTFHEKIRSIDHAQNHCIKYYYYCYLVLLLSKKYLIGKCEKISFQTLKFLRFWKKNTTVKNQYRYFLFSPVLSPQFSFGEIMLQIFFNDIDVCKHDKHDNEKKCDKNT